MEKVYFFIIDAQYYIETLRVLNRWKEIGIISDFGWLIEMDGKLRFDLWN